jgi:predicted branched-subunit amino acid permease
MAILLLLIACLLAIAGVFSINQATTGVGFMVGACFLGIFARLVQASDHHREIKKLLQKGEQN